MVKAESVTVDQKQKSVEPSASSFSLRIGFDGKRALQNFTGLGNYSRYIISLLARFYPDNEYLLYTPKEQETGMPVSVRTPRGMGGSFWRTFGLAADLERDKVDIYHGLSNELPYGIRKSGARSVVTIHDVIFKRFPSYYKPVDRFIYGLKTRYACRAADRIIAISRQTKADLVRFYKVEENKIEVVYQDCAPVFREACTHEQLESVKQKYALPHRFILSVGTIENRKNQLLLVQALKELPTDISLVLVGRKTPYADKIIRYIADHKLQGRVKILDRVSFADLPAIYRQAALFAYPSRFEGFGIPLVEALRSDVPVIAARGSCLEEAGGPGSVYIDPENASELAQKAKNILENDQLRAEMLAKGKEHLKNFDDELIAGQMMGIYNNLHLTSRTK